MTKTMIGINTMKNDRYVSKLKEMFKAPTTMRKIVPGPSIELINIANWYTTYLKINKA